jgi:cobalt/nickel transport system permease protein
VHIPDGYLSPSTCIVMYAAAAPFWVRAMARIRRHLKGRQLPLVALFAAASFVVMMFNVPLPGGTTGHAVGAVLAAIVLGPWPAVLAISVALIIQAVFFGDGGILAIGANCFNMAIAMPFSGYLVYRLVSGWAPKPRAAGPADAERGFFRRLLRRTRVVLTSRPAAAAIAGYVGLGVAALLAAVEFGVQPLLFKAADGTPLYGPYALNVAIPAMMIPHLLVVGFIEGAITGLVVAYLQRAHREMLEPGPSEAQAVPGAEPAPKRRRLWPLWVGLGVLVLLVPVGLLAPGTAWGEWGAEELTSLGMGFIPQGLERLGSIWNAPMPDYAVPFLGERVGYIVSAVLGVGLIVLFFWLVGLVVDRPRRRLTS